MCYVSMCHTATISRKCVTMLRAKKQRYVGHCNLGTSNKLYRELSN